MTAPLSHRFWLGARALAAGAAVGLLASCGDGSRDRGEKAAAHESERQTPVQSDPGFAPFACAPGSGGDAPPDLELAHRARALQLADEVDFVSVRRVFAGAPPQTLAERGTMCSGAADTSVCRAALEQLEQKALAAAPRCEAEPCDSAAYVLTTKGDMGRLVRGAEELVQLLGPIDTPEDAWLLAQANEGAHPYLCGDPEVSAQRASAGAYELRERRYTRLCKPVEQTEFIYRVDRTGQSRTLSQKVVKSELDSCTSGAGATRAAR